MGSTKSELLPQLVMKFIQMSWNCDLVTCPVLEMPNITNVEAVGLHKILSQNSVALSKSRININPCHNLIKIASLILFVSLSIPPS